MACEYREADRSKLEATSSYAGAIADEIIIIDRVGEYSGPCDENDAETTVKNNGCLSSDGDRYCYNHNRFFAS
mgnify:CR=1 FL=1